METRLVSSRLVVCRTERKDKQKGVARPAVRMQMLWKFWNFKGMKRKRHTPTKNIQSSAEGKRSGVSRVSEECTKRRREREEKEKSFLFRFREKRNTFFHVYRKISLATRIDRII